MNFPPEQREELKRLFSNVQYGEEGGVGYFLFPQLPLPSNCRPAATDALLCPTATSGYNSRLFFADKIITGTNLNWNAVGVRILERNWHAFSWQLKQPGLTLAQMTLAHIRGLAC